MKFSDVLAAAVAAHNGTYATIGLAGAYIDACGPPYNAIGDNATVNTTALANAEYDAATKGLAVVLGKPGIFLTDAPTALLASIKGLGSNATRLKPAGSSLDGSYLLDFNAAGTDKTIEDIKFDMAFRTCAAQGSSGDASGSPHTEWHRVAFFNGEANTPAVGGDSTTVIAGMLTGSLFAECLWQNVPVMGNFGVNQDDVTLLNPRVIMTPTGSGGVGGPNRAPIRLAGQNIHWIGGYVYLAPSILSATDKPIFEIGSNTVHILGLFIENSPGGNYTHLFYAINPNYRLNVDNLQFGMSSYSGLVAIARANLASATKAGTARMEIDGITVKSGSTLPLVYEVLATTTTNTERATLGVAGCDAAAGLIALAPGGSSSQSKITLIGDYADKRYANDISVNRGVAYLPPMSEPSMYRTELTTSSASGASPRTATFTMPGEGVWDVTVVAEIDGHYAYAAVGSWQVYNFRSGIGGTIGNVQQVGTTVLATGIPATLTALTLTISAGVLTASVSFSDAGPHSVVWVGGFYQKVTVGYATN